MSFGTLKLTL